MTWKDRSGNKKGIFKSELVKKKQTIKRVNSEALFNSKLDRASVV